MLDRLQQHLQDHILDLKGEWISKRSSYEVDICRILKMTTGQNTYWDAVWDGNPLEFKKGHSIWLNLVRYSKMLLGCDEVACKEVHTLFFLPNIGKSHIENIILVEAKALMKATLLTKTEARALLAIEQCRPGKFNAQARLTVKEVKDISTFIVSFNADHSSKYKGK